MYYFEALLRITIICLLIIVCNDFIYYFINNTFILRKLQPLVPDVELEEAHAIAVFFEFFAQPVVVVGRDQEVVGAADQGDWEGADGLKIIVRRIILAVSLSIQLKGIIVELFELAIAQKL